MEYNNDDGVLNLIRYALKDCFSSYSASDASLRDEYAKSRIEYINGPVLDVYCVASGDSYFQKKKLRKQCYDFHFNKEQFQKQTGYISPGDSEVHEGLQ